MIDKDTKNIERVKNEIEQWEKSANKHGRLYLVVTVQHDCEYDYYCHYSGYTMASSEKQALNNLRGRIKREKGLTMDSKLELNLKYLKQV